MEIVCPCCGVKSDKFRALNSVFNPYTHAVKVLLDCPECCSCFEVFYEPTHSVEVTEDLRIKE